MRFAPGETSKTISIPIIDDSYAEGTESFTVTLSNATGASRLIKHGYRDHQRQRNGKRSKSSRQADFFVRLHYLDFLNRELIRAAWRFWSDQITSCGADIACIELRRINVSASVFISIEFSRRRSGPSDVQSSLRQLTNKPVPVRFTEFLRIRSRLARMWW